MNVQDLQSTLQTTLTVSRPTLRNVRDALVDYYAVVARQFIEKGLAHTHPGADDDLVRRILMLRLGTLWNDLSSSWDTPSLNDLHVFRNRIERYACVRETAEIVKVQRMLDELLLAASLGERLQAVRTRRGGPQLKLIDGGGEGTQPRGRLRLVGHEAG